MRYEVTRVLSLNPQRLQKASLGLFKQDGGAGRLVAISTEKWDGARYQRSTVVTAVPLGQPRGLRRLSGTCAPSAGPGASRSRREPCRW